MITKELKVPNKELYPMYNIFLSKLRKLFDCNNIFDLPFAIINLIEVEFTFTHSDEFCDLPTEHHKYLSPSKNINYAEELGYLYQKNISAKIDSIDENKSKIIIDFKVNINHPNVENILIDYLSGHLFSDYTSGLYIIKAMEILNERNIILSKDLNLPNINSYISSTYKNVIVPIGIEIYNSIKSNCELQNAFSFPKKDILKAFENVDFNKYIKDRVVFNTTDMTIVDSLVHSYVIYDLDGIDESIYLRDLFVNNVDNYLFMGSALSLIYQRMIDFNNENKYISDAEFLFLKECLEIMDQSDFDKRFPQQTPDLSNVVVNLSHYPIADQTFESVTAYIK